MNYGLAEVEIAQRINERFTALGLQAKFFAAPMPETDTEAKEFEAQVSKALCAVEFLDSTYDGNTALGCVRQFEHVKFRLNFQAKKLRGSEGLYTMVEHVKKFLIGYELTNAEPMTVSAYGKLQFEPGVWLPFLEMECKTLNVQDFAEPDGELLKKVDFYSNPQVFGEEYSTQFQ